MAQQARGRKVGPGFRRDCTLLVIDREGNMPRVPPITGKDDVPAAHHNVVDDVLGVFGRIRGPFSVLLHSPELASKLLPMVPFNRDGTIVEPGPRVAAILAAVREREG